MFRVAVCVVKADDHQIIRFFLFRAAAGYLPFLIARISWRRISIADSIFSMRF